MPRANVVIDCSVCQKTHHTIPGADLDGMSRPEVFDVLGPVLQKAGWAERSHADKRVGRYFVCPECLATEARALAALPPYDETTKCAKCGHGSLTTNYKTGREQTALVPVEHLIRVCSRCGYAAAQRPLDHQKGTEVHPDGR
jgi:ribosomal protein L37E